jgi:hypothetical protein
VMYNSEFRLYLLSVNAATRRAFRAGNAHSSYYRVHHVRKTYGHGGADRRIPEPSDEFWDPESGFEGLNPSITYAYKDTGRAIMCDAIFLPVLSTGSPLIKDDVYVTTFAERLGPGWHVWGLERLGVQL